MSRLLNSYTRVWHVPDCSILFTAGGEIRVTLTRALARDEFALVHECKFTLKLTDFDPSFLCSDAPSLRMLYVLDMLGLNSYCTNVALSIPVDSKTLVPRASERPHKNLLPGCMSRLNSHEFS